MELLWEIKTDGLKDCEYHDFRARNSWLNKEIDKDMRESKGVCGSEVYGKGMNERCL